MKILAVTDIHGIQKRLLHLENLIKHSKPDLILCSGDLTNFGRHMGVIAKKLDSFNIPIYIIAGNHETDEDMKTLESKYKNFKSINFKIYETTSFVFFGYGQGGFAKQDLAFEKAFSKVKQMINSKKKLIILSHSPPAGTAQDFVHGNHVGSKTLRKFIELMNPVLAVVGHIHECEHTESYIGKSRIINPGDGEIISF